MNEEEQRDKVVALVDAVNAVLAGNDIAETTTAMTFAVVALIVATSTDDEDRKMQAREFTRQVADYVAREDIVEWIKAGITPVAMKTRTQ